MSAVAETGAGQQVERTPALGRPSFARRLLTTPSGIAGALMVGVVAVACLLAPWLVVDPLAQELTSGGVLQSPAAAHPMGTDQLGRDVLSRVLYGGRTTLMVAGAGLTVAIVLGVALGVVAGFYGRWADRVVMRLTDALLAFPLLILAIAVSAAFQRGAIGLVFALCAVNIPVFTRLARAQTLQIVQRQYVTAAVSVGAGAIHRMVRHVLPNMANVIIVQGTVALSFAIIIEAGLSFLGLGVQPPAPSWGGMIAEAKSFISRSPHLMLAPGLTIFVSVLGLNLLGDALGDALDPRSAEGPG